MTLDTATSRCQRRLTLDRHADATSDIPFPGSGPADEQHAVDINADGC